MLKDLSLLEKEGVIDSQTAAKIRDYYKQKKKPFSEIGFLLFKIIAVILILSGTILLMAHNWDNIGKPAKIFIAFLPLVLGHIFCFYILTKKNPSRSSKESGAVFVYLALLACLSLISQIYHIQGNIYELFLICMILSLPLIYILQSTALSFIYITSLTFIDFNSLSFIKDFYIYYPSFLCLLLIIPFYCFLHKKKNKYQFTLHRFLFSLILIYLFYKELYPAIGFIVITKLTGFFWFTIYIIRGIDIHLKENSYTKKIPFTNWVFTIGNLVILVQLFFASYKTYWYYRKSYYYDLELFDAYRGLWIFLIVLGVYIFMFWRFVKGEKLKSILYNPVSYAPILMLILFYLQVVLGFNYSYVGVNMYILLLSFWYIKQGSKSNSISMINQGFLIFIAFLILKLLDSNISFLFKGLSFITTGLFFAAVNYRSMKKRFLK